MTATAPARRPAARATSSAGHRGPKHGRGAKHRQPRVQRSRMRRILRWLALGVLVGLVGAGALLWYASRIPLPEPVTLQQTSFVHAADGSVLAELYDTQQRVDIPFRGPEDAYTYADLPPHVIQAFIAREDQRFFEHGGVDLHGIGRALWRNVTGTPQGGSTITQQYVKNAFVGDERTLTRKLKEAVIAVKLSRKYSKPEIMSMYLNIVYFGRGAYGIEAAAQEFFSKRAADLTVGEVAFLAGALNNPSTADPVKHPAEATKRRDETLAAMVETGALEPSEAKAARAAPLTLALRQRKTIASAGGSAYFVEEVRQRLIERFGKEAVYGGGLQVTTTIDPTLQASAEEAVRDELGRDADPAAAVVTLDRDGRIRAMVGGNDFSASQVNLALGAGGGGSGRQAGSVFKPIVLAAALKEGISPRKTFPAPKQTTIRTDGCPVWEPSNAGDARTGGRMDLITATQWSSNTVYARLSDEVGVQATTDMARSLGVQSALDTCPRLALGTSDVSLLEMANVYGVFMNRGERPIPDSQFISKVTDPAGEVLWEPAVGREQVLEQGDADTITSTLEKVVDAGTGTKARLDDFDVAGKTGTTNDNKDAWFIGYTPEYVTAVWVGYPQPEPLTNVHGVRRVYGGTIPAQIWHDHMERVMEGVADPGEFPEPVRRDDGRRAIQPGRPAYPF